jgi:hypothetical protein
VTKSMDHPVWECGDGADVGEVCTGWDMTNAGLIWEWEWGGGEDIKAEIWLVLA